MSPSFLYKYLDIKGGLSMLRGQNLQFTNATYFNDPFDCHPSLIDCTKAPQRPNNWPPSDFLSAKAETDLTNARNNTWISCLSKRFDNLLMWSYYTNHRGICIGLDRERLSRYINSNLGMIVFGHGIDVEYKDILQRPDYFNSPIDVFHYQFCTKGKQWAHEEEVRFAIIEPLAAFVPYALNRKPKKKEVVDWKEVRFYPKLGVECFHSIYLGCKISDQDRTEILKVARELYPEMAIYQLSVNPNKFGFDAIPINN